MTQARAFPVPSAGREVLESSLSQSSSRCSASSRIICFQLVLGLGDFGGETNVGCDCCCRLVPRAKPSSMPWAESSSQPQALRYPGNTELSLAAGTDATEMVKC